jgi:predicted RNase H-like nuclease
MAPASLVGVDGCKGAWVCVFATPDATPAVCILPTARSVLARFPSPAIIAVDIPIGLTDADRRTCDVEARKRLRSPRASSVFPAPIRPILNCSSRHEASELHRRIDGRGFGAQAWGILPKIKEWDDALQSERSRRSEVFEVHPELCFWMLDGETPMRFSKRTEAGARERRRLLNVAFGRGVVTSVYGSASRRGAKDDDVLDALALLWTAGRIERGEARSLPAKIETDRAGLPMAIWY